MHSWENISWKVASRHCAYDKFLRQDGKKGQHGALIQGYRVYTQSLYFTVWLRLPGINYTQHAFPFLPFPLQYCSMVVPSHCLPVYGCTGVPSFCAICFSHWHHQFKVPYFLPSERDRRYQNVLDRLALPLKEWLHLVFFISDEFAILGLVNVFWLGCDLPKGASQRPWSKQLRVKFKLNSIEWMTPCSLVPQFLTAHGPGFWSILYHVPPFHSCEHPSLQGFTLVDPNEKQSQ